MTSALSLLRCLLLGSGLLTTARSQTSIFNVSQELLTVSLDLIDANHILHFLSVVDAFGHVSVRNPDNSSQFILSFSLAPALVTSQALVTYEIDNATALALTFNSSVTGDAVPSGFAERFIHSEIYKSFPDVMGVVHSHTTEVLPFAIARVPLIAQMHTAGSVGAVGTPIFDTSMLPTSVLPENAPHDQLIRTAILGEALAQTFVNGSQVVLMRGHGMSVRGSSVRDAVFRSVYTRDDAIVQLNAAMLGGSTGLSAREAADGANTTESESLLGRAWGLWTAQVATMGEGLYVNDLTNATAS
ncbi:arad-like aldolase/epimerase [Stereum hirsutum FP-91666 SS1]|uniref:arad-like aldolase/epimerase n=1 Tax=Stereum hirsutum (strain FP-91666) TaxID=721885 RepID=UPI0004449415|nr:arad-like aldolase/epimerase [Stereum hirsutum FP-91666 SS1]EIM84660.1 arad-like aldolase/epimerase [Stereum hirsutum FP-91666 SS1]